MRFTIRRMRAMKVKKEKIPMITAYDANSANLVEEAGIMLILVGDSLGQWVLGHESTVPVTMDDMVHHVRAVVRGTKKAHVVGDMPFMSYQSDVSQAINNAGRLVKDGGAQSVKLEGGIAIADTVSRIVERGVPVMGHIGFTPQSVNQLGGYMIQGKTQQSAVSLIKDAEELEAAGAYSIVLEMVPARVAALITERVSVPTIGIGAGVGCDGQVQVFHDLLGLLSDFAPKHARRYAEIGNDVKNAVATYIKDVNSGQFPSDQESHRISDDVIREVSAVLS